MSKKQSNPPPPTGQRPAPPPAPPARKGLDSPAPMCSNCRGFITPSNDLEVCPYALSGDAFCIECEHDPCPIGLA